MKRTKRAGMLKDERVERSTLRIKLLKMIADGDAEDKIRKQMKMNLEEYVEFRRECLQWSADAIREKSIGEVYAEYVLNQKKCINDLESMAEKFSSKQQSAYVSSIKARADIFDRMIKVGQEFGILEKKAERKEIVAGVMVAKMEDDELRQTVIGELVNLKGMMDSIVGTGIMELPVGALHRPGPKPGVVKSSKRKKGHTSIMNRIHRGRRVVKGGEP